MTGTIKSTVVTLSNTAEKTAVIMPNNIKIKEISLSHEKISKNKVVFSFLSKLKILCNRGLKEKLTLWGISD